MIFGDIFPSKLGLQKKFSPILSELTPVGWVGISLTRLSELLLKSVDKSSRL